MKLFNLFIIVPTLQTLIIWTFNTDIRFSDYFLNFKFYILTMEHKSFPSDQFVFPCSRVARQYDTLLSMLLKFIMDLKTVDFTLWQQRVTMKNVPHLNMLAKVHTFTQSHNSVLHSLALWFLVRSITVQQWSVEPRDWHHKVKTARWWSCKGWVQLWVQLSCPTICFLYGFLRGSI